MKVLYITNAFPYPLTSGYLRHYFLIKELARRHAVTLLSVVGGTFDSGHLAALEPYTERIITFTSKARGGPLLRRFVHRADARLRGDGAIREMRTALRDLIARDQYDVLVLSGKHTYAAVKGLHTPPVIADMCDATSVRLRGALSHTRGLAYASTWLEHRQVRRIERDIMNHAQHVLFASMRDCEALAPSRPATVVPNGVDLEYWRRTSRSHGHNTLVFTGAMSYPPNTDAARYLITAIMPLVRAAVPDAQVVIAGHSPPPDLVTLGTQPGVTVTGFVEDVRPFLERGTVFVAPIRFGAGIQNKLLEALAMELPVVASPLAADGLRTVEGACPFAHTAETPDQYAALIVNVLRQDAACVTGAREFISRWFVWQRSGEQLTRVIEDAGRHRR
jgi:polysaccharide biosynthesis protein PslH